MSSPAVALPAISSGARLACIGAVSALSILGGMLVPSLAEAATTAVGQGTYENDDAAVTLNGTWTKVASNQDSGGSTSSLSTAGYAELSFKTSGIRWITRKNGYSGIADVYVDGVKKTSVDLYSSTTRTQQVAYEVTGLSETTHTLRIVRTGTKNAASSSANIMLDAFVAPDVHAPDAPTGLKAVVSGAAVALTWDANAESDVKAYRVYRREGSSTTRTLVGTDNGDLRSLSDGARSPGASYTYDVVAVDTSDQVSGYSSAESVTMPISAKGAGTYENTSSAVTLSGPWSAVSSGMDSGGSYASLNAAGYAEISFKTSGIRWISRTNSYSGIADVYLDGVKKASVDLYSSTTKYQQVAYEATGLTETPHTLRIVRTGTKNAASSSPTITVDSFVAPDIYAPSAPTAVTTSAIRTGATVSWTASPEPDVASYRVFRRTSSTPDVLVATTGPQTTSFDDVGLADATGYTWTVVARDTSNNDSPASAAGTFTTAAGPVVTTQRYATCPTATTTVSTRNQLLAAIAAATPGTVIRLNPGSYGANYDITTTATPDKPIWICGPRTAIIDNADTTKGYGFRVTGASNLVLAGMTVRNVQKARPSPWPTCASRTSATKPSTSRPRPPTAPSSATPSTAPARTPPTTAKASTSAPPRATGASTTTASPTPATATSWPTTTSAPPPRRTSRPRPAPATAPCGRTPSTAPPSPPPTPTASSRSWATAGSSPATPAATPPPTPSRSGTPTPTTA
jgi:hypothetical protein